MPHFERAGFDEGNGNWTLLRVEVRFEDEGETVAFGVASEVVHFGNEQDMLEEFVDVFAVLGADFNRRVVATPFFEEDIVVGKLLLDARDICFGFVDFVDGDDGRDMVFADIGNDFFGLRADAVIGGNDQNGDVGEGDAAFAHGGKGFVTGCIDKGDEFAALFDLIGTDRLGDAAGLFARDIGFADRIEEGGFAVIDVSQDGDDGRARVERFSGGFFLRAYFEEAFERESFAPACFEVFFGFESHILRDDARGFEVDFLVDGGEDFILHELHDDGRHRRAKNFRQAFDAYG